jgi:hypothetical protein
MCAYRDGINPTAVAASGGFFHGRGASVATRFYSARIAATKCARRMLALDKTKMPTPNSTIALTVWSTALTAPQE